MLTTLWGIGREALGGWDKLNEAGICSREALRTTPQEHRQGGYRGGTTRGKEIITHKAADIKAESNIAAETTNNSEGAGVVCPIRNIQDDNNNTTRNIQ